MSEEHPLDGAYRITSTTTGVGDLEKRTDGETRIQDSQTERLDHAWCKWTSTFQIIDDNTVRMTSTADPTNAAIDFMLTKPDGSPTREPVTYMADLKLARKGEGEIQMSGQIEYGHDVIFLTMRRIGD